MDKSPPPLTAETQALKDAYAALNRGDIPEFTKILDPQIEWIEPPDIPGSGTRHSLVAVTEHISQARASWAEGTCEPERFITTGDKIIVFAYVRVRLKHETQWREGHIADVYTFHNGKAVQKRTFVNRREALEWAGVKAVGAG